jgi:hypothetical protein
MPEWFTFASVAAQPANSPVRIQERRIASARRALRRIPNYLAAPSPERRQSCATGTDDVKE